MTYYAASLLDALHVLRISQTLIIGLPVLFLLNLASDILFCAASPANNVAATFAALSL